MAGGRRIMTVRHHVAGNVLQITIYKIENSYKKRRAELTAPTWYHRGSAIRIKMTIVTGGCSTIILIILIFVRSSPGQLSYWWKYSPEYDLGALFRRGDN